MKKLILLPLVACALVACGGGGGGSAANQKDANLANFEAAAISNSYYSLGYNYPTNGAAPVSGTHYFYRRKFHWSLSPAEGLSVANPTVENMASSLPLPNMGQQNITRFIRGGSIFYTSALDAIGVTIVGGKLVQQNRASDQTTVVSSDIIESWSSSIGLSGAMLSSPDEVRASEAVLTRSASPLFDLTKSWQTGAAYIRRVRTLGEDRLIVFDWSGLTVDASPVPFPGAATTLEELFAAFPNGITVGSQLHTLASGQIKTVNGVRTWVSNITMPTSVRPTETYYAYFELNNKLYAANYTKAGTTEKRLSALDGTVVLDYSIRWNREATESFRAALNF